MTTQTLTTLLAKVAPTAAEIAASAAVQTNDYQVWLTNLDGYVVLNWSSPTTGSYDFVALYAPGANEDDPHGYITNQWQYATRGNSYQTGTTSGPGYVAVYWTWNYAAKPAKWVAVKVSSPSS